MKASLVLATLAIHAADCVASPYQSPGSTIRTFDQTTSHIVIVTEEKSVFAVIPAAAQSKMSTSLLSLNRASKPSTAPLLPTTSPTTETLLPSYSPNLAKHVSFVPTRPEENVAAFPDDMEVRCDTDFESTAPYHSIEIPYYYQVETMEDTRLGVLVRWIGSSFLDFLAKNLICEQNEEIRRSLSAGAHYVIAASSSPRDIIFNEYTCPSDSNARSCYVIEAKLTMIVQSGHEVQDDTIVTKAYTEMRRAFAAIDDQSTAPIKYIDPACISKSDWLMVVCGRAVELKSIDKLRKRSDSESENTSVFAIIFLSISICCTLGGTISLATAYVRSRDENKRANTTRVTSTSTDDIVDVSDIDDVELGSSYLPSHHVTFARNLILDEEEDADADYGVEISSHDWCRFVFLQSMALSQSTLQRVPEETSEDYGCEDSSI